MTINTIQTWIVKFRDKHNQFEEWSFIGYSPNDAWNCFKEYKPDGAELVSISVKPEWD
jgi:hypothetical protein